MTALVQIFLVAVISVLTFFVALAGVQLVRIFQELRLTLQKLNRILDHTQTLSASAAKPITAVNDFFTEVKDLVDETEDEIIAETPDRVITPPHHHSASSSRRFFRRSGLPLRPS